MSLAAGQLVMGKAMNLAADDAGDLLRALARMLGAPWRALASCAPANQVPTDWYFPDEEGPVGARSLRRARATCARCPVRLTCLVEALSYDSIGIWAGTTTAQRTRTAGLPLAERVRALDVAFRAAATSGPWRVVQEVEELGIGERALADEGDHVSAQALQSLPRDPVPVPT